MFSDMDLQTRLLAVAHATYCAPERLDIEVVDLVSFKVALCREGHFAKREITLEVPSQFLL